MSDENGKKKESSTCGCGNGSCCSGPGKWIWIVLVVAIAAVLIAKNAGKPKAAESSTAVSGIPAAVNTNGTAGVSEPAGKTKALPRLVDLGAGKCIPCKMMAPILEELRTNYAARFEVQFIDVWEKPEESDKYGISMIPTQIFYDASGKELFRHQGFYAKEDILAKWKELGVETGDPAVTKNTVSKEK